MLVSLVLPLTALWYLIDTLKEDVWMQTIFGGVIVGLVGAAILVYKKGQ